MLIVALFASTLVEVVVVFVVTKRPVFTRLSVYQWGTYAGLAMLLVLSFITPVFEKIPYNAMGAIIFSSVLHIFNPTEAIFLFKANKFDFMVWVTAFLGTVLLGVEFGLAIAVGLAVLLVIYQSAAPHTAVLGHMGRGGALSV
jgi:MFS superfamily sulfate permease-like transporter